MERAEDRLRCALIDSMVKDLGYPRSLIVVEKKIELFLCDQKKKGQLKPPPRRLDLLCLMPNLSPLLLVECKATSIQFDAINQVLSYNHWIQAPFFALAEPRGILFASLLEKKWDYQWRETLPPFKMLAHCIDKIDQPQKKRK